VTRARGDVTELEERALSRRSAALQHGVIMIQLDKYKKNYNTVAESHYIENTTLNVSVT